MTTLANKITGDNFLVFCRIQTSNFQLIYWLALSYKLNMIMRKPSAPPREWLIEGVSLGQRFAGQNKEKVSRTTMVKLLSKYKDDELVVRAERALGDDPTVDSSRLEVSSNKGAVVVRGKVSTTRARDHAINVMRRSFERAGLKYENIIDELTIG